MVSPCTPLSDHPIFIFSELCVRMQGTYQRARFWWDVITSTMMSPESWSHNWWALMWQHVMEILNIISENQFKLNLIHHKLPQFKMLKNSWNIVNHFKIRLFKCQRLPIFYVYCRPFSMLLFTTSITKTTVKIFL